jgi:RsiW-degrading membrane proteinase PrsW (M82 family)
MDYLNNHNFSHNKKTILSDAYLFLQKKSTNSDSINKAYNIINGFDIDKIKDNNDTVSEQNVSSNILYTQDLSNKITKNLGLEQINNFSLSNFFSEAFRKHHADEAEKLLSVGTSDTTPIPNHNMGNMPKPWIFFRALVGTLITYLIFLAAWHSYNNIYLIPGLIILGSFAVPFSVLILFFELNTPKNISMLKVIQFVVIGGAISLFISLILFDLTSLDKFFGAASAGFIEESAKLFAVLVLVKLNQKKQYNYLLNALLFGAAVGTGFAAFESAGYALNIGLTSTDVMTDNIQLRGALSPFSHIIWTAIAAFAYWKAKPYYNSLWGTLISYRFIKIFLIPVTLHFIWNLPFEGPFMIKYILLGFVGWVVIISFVEEGLKEISNIIKNVKNDTPKNIS